MIAKFLDHLAELDRVPGTIEGYQVDLGLFVQWFQKTTGQPFTPETVTPLDVREWKRELIGQNRAAGTINRKIASLLGFYNWANEQGHVQHNPAQNIKRLKQVKTAPKWLTRQETYALLRVAQEAVQLAGLGHSPLKKMLTVRNLAMVALMLHAGLRVSEVCKLRGGDIQLRPRSGLVTVRHGKGGKYRAVPLNIDARRAVSGWVKAHKGGGGLFDRCGRRLHIRTVQTHVKQLGRRAGIEEKLTPHRLRHTFGKSLIDAGVSLDRAALLLGHSDVNTTAIYTRPSEADLQKAVDLIAWSD